MRPPRQFRLLQLVHVLLMYALSPSPLSFSRRHQRPRAHTRAQALQACNASSPTYPQCRGNAVRCTACENMYAVPVNSPDIQQWYYEDVAGNSSQFRIFQQNYTVGGKREVMTACFPADLNCGGAEGNVVRYVESDTANEKVTPLPHTRCPWCAVGCWL